VTEPPDKCLCGMARSTGKKNSQSVGRGKGVAGGGEAKGETGE